LEKEATANRKKKKRGPRRTGPLLGVPMLSYAPGGGGWGSLGLRPRVGGEKRKEKAKGGGSADVKMRERYLGEGSSPLPKGKKVTMGDGSLPRSR